MSIATARVGNLVAAASMRTAAAAVSEAAAACAGGHGTLRCSINVTDAHLVPAAAASAADASQSIGASWRAKRRMAVAPERSGLSTEAVHGQTVHKFVTSVCGEAGKLRIQGVGMCADASVYPFVVYCRSIRQRDLVDLAR